MQRQRQSQPIHPSADQKRQQHTHGQHCAVEYGQESRSFRQTGTHRAQDDNPRLWEDCERILFPRNGRQTTVGGAL